MKIQELYRQTLTDGRYDPAIFKAVFMAGSPGSGKTTIAKKLFTGTGLRELNVDRFWDLFHKSDKAKDYERMYHLTGKQKANWIDGRLGLLVDGTARNLDAMKSVKIELEEIGYETLMVFVNTDLETALKRVAAREKQTGRHVPEEFVVESWKSVQRNLGSLQMLFGYDMFIIDNSEGEPETAFVQRYIDKWLKRPPITPEAKAWIEQQLEKK